jgi:hypothetical protein
MGGYPSWRYHRELPALIVKSEEEDKALGEGWADSPARFLEPETYREHQAKWTSKEEKLAESPKKKRGRS